MNPHYTSFWLLVYQCLLEFHGFNRDTAQRAIREFRLKLENLRESDAADLVYHQEPFYLAAELAGHEAREPSEEEGKRYDVLLKQCTEEAGALGTAEEVIAYAKGGKAA